MTRDRQTNHVDLRDALPSFNAHAGAPALIEELQAYKDNADPLIWLPGVHAAKPMTSSPVSRGKDAIFDWL